MIKSAFLCNVLILNVYYYIAIAQTEPHLGLPLGHLAQVNYAEYNNAENLIVTASDDFTVKIWNASKGKLLHTLYGHRWNVVMAKFSPDDSKILSSAQDGSLKIWNVIDGALLLELDGHDEEIVYAEWSADNERIFSASVDGIIKIWNAKNGNVIYCIDVKVDLLSVQWSKDEQYILISTVKGDILVWNIHKESAIVFLNIPKLKRAIWSPDNHNLLAYTSEEIFEYGPKENSPEHKINNFQSDITLVDWSPDGSKLLITTSNGESFVWDVFQNKQVSKHKGDSCEIIANTWCNESKKIACCYRDGRCVVWNSENGEDQLVIEKHRLLVNSLKWSKNNQNILTASADKTAKIINAERGYIVNDLTGRAWQIKSSAFNSTNTLFYTISSDRKIRIWDRKYLHLIDCIDGYMACFSPCGNYLLVASDDNIVRIWECEKETLSDKFIRTDEWVNSIDWSADSKMALISSSDCITRLWDLTSVNDCKEIHSEFCFLVSSKWAPDGKKFFLVQNPQRPEVYFLNDMIQPHVILGAFRFINTVSWSPNSEMILTTSSGSKYLKIHYVLKDSIVQIIDAYDSELANAIWSPDGNSIVTTHLDGTMCLLKINENKKMQYKNKAHEGEIQDIVWSANGQEILTSSRDQTSKKWCSETGKLLFELKGHRASVVSSSFSPDNKHIMTSSEDGSCIFWDNKTGEILIRLIAIDKTDRILMTPDNYYHCTSGFITKLYWIVNNTKIYSFEQFDLKYNRPDKVLEKLGSSSPELIEAYHKAYLKRIRKMGFTEEQLDGEFHIPETEIEKFEYMPVIEEKDINIELNFNDSLYKLDRYNIWINEVPLYGIVGKSLRAFNTNEYSIKEKIELMQGKNKIQVSCLNEKGAESYKESVNVTYQPKDPVTGKNYLVAISVSDYKDARYNLKYAVKDGRDMATMFAAKDCSIDTLFNQNATRDSILALKQKLMQTKVDDEVILYVSGHGLLDKNYDFYFATYDMNFENPAEHGILYDDLEGLLDGIPARKKLLLMDACHSGGVDKEDIRIADSLLAINNAKGDLKIYSYKGTDLEGEEGSGLGLQNSFELMQELFANLSRGSGAVVISAASGVGYALESADWKNGVFTYCILNGLKSNNGKLPADSNKDGQVTVSELKDYVSAEVERLTNGAQKPTSRRESLEFDWGVW